MTKPVEIRFVDRIEGGLADQSGRIALVLAGPDGLDGIKALPRPAAQAARRALEGKAWGKLKPGEALELGFPAGMQAEALQLVRLADDAGPLDARKAGASIGARMGKDSVTVICPAHPHLTDLALGLALRGYDFDVYRSSDKAGGDATEGTSDTPEALPQGTAPSGAAPDAAFSDPAQPAGKVRGGKSVKSAPNPVAAPDPAAARVTILCDDPQTVARAAAHGAALAEGVFFTRDLVNEPANILTTDDFAARLLAMQELGLEVEVLEEDALARLGLRALLAVGQGSASPSKVVIMRWNGGGDEAPLALVGKGVVFDTGGISIKPSAGMEEMTMDMGGAGVVSGVMRTLALRRARANVVGLVGLVENMPDGRAQRPGDIVRSMKGDTIEVENTDAEGRLVLADVLWLAQERYAPRAIVDLATLTGACIIALGYANTGVFSNDDAFVDDLLAAARAEGEGAWRLPLGAAYDEQIKSRLADVKNTGGRPAGASTAAAFLQRFIRPGTPWVHLDIAGTTLPPQATTLAPKGATGWGVLTLDRLIRDGFEVQAEATGGKKGGKGGKPAAKAAVKAPTKAAAKAVAKATAKPAAKNVAKPAAKAGKAARKKG